MSSFATELGLPGNRSFAVMFEFRVASFPVVAEYLSISKFSHDCSLLRYLKKNSRRIVAKPNSDTRDNFVYFVVSAPRQDLCREKREL